MENDAEELLRLAEERMSESLQRLVQVDGTWAGCASSLEEAARVLELLRKHSIEFGDGGILEQVLQRLSTQAIQANRLLEGAAAFYRGWLSVSCGPTGNYGRNGGPEPISGAGAMKMDA